MPADPASPGIHVQRGTHTSTLALTEEYDTTDQPDESELDNPRLYPWQRIPKRHRNVPSERLALELTDDAYGYKGRSRRWADRTRWKLEDKLDDILAEIHARADLDEQRQQDAERAQLDRRQRWEQAMVQARRQYAEDHCVKALDKQIQAWRGAQEIRAYADALHRTMETGTGPEQLETWIAWIRMHADTLDPLIPSPSIPVPPEPDPANLKPYLKGWNPYGPEPRSSSW